MPSTLRMSLFTFLMSGHRFPVSASMMMGDVDYLRRQLRLACTTDDPALQQLATHMLRQLADGTPAAMEATAPWLH